MKINYTIQDLTRDLGKSLYENQKANTFCLLESQIEGEQKLKACKSLANASLKGIHILLKSHLTNILKDWNVEIDKECRTCKENSACVWRHAETNNCVDDNYKFWKIDLNSLHK